MAVRGIVQRVCIQCVFSVCSVCAVCLWDIVLRTIEYDLFNQQFLKSPLSTRMTKTSKRW